MPNVATGRVRSIETIMIAKIFRLKRTAAFDSFAQDRRGAVAIMFAVALVPLIACIGAAIDYSRLLGRRAILTNVIDSSLLMVMQSYSGSATTAQLATLQTQATNEVRTMLRDNTATVTLTQNSNGSLCVAGSASVPLAIMQMLGSATKQINASACSLRATTFEVALVLDNTGSMANSAGGVSKMQALQTAAGQLVSILNPVPATPSAAISVVPFSSAVNVGTANANASWMDKTGQSSIHWQNYTRPAGAPWLPTSRFDLFTQMNTAWGGCVEERPAPYLTTDTAATSANPDTLFVPYLAPDEAGAATGSAAYSFTPSSAYPATAWNGQYYSFNSYLDDSGGSCTANDAYAQADNTDPVSSGSGATKLCKYKGQTPANVSSAVSGVNGGSGLFPATPNFGCYTQPLQTLTTDNAVISGTNGIISKMTPNGDTNLLSGFMWGWRTISPNGPFTGVTPATGVGLKVPKAYNIATNTKVIVLMTDGFNHWVSNPYSPYQSIYSSLGMYVNNRISSFASNYMGANSSGPTNSANYRAQMDAALLDACTNAKAAGVHIFTVGFSTSTDPIDAQGLSLLSSCASDPTASYTAQDQTSLYNAFQTIANSIKRLRLVT